MKTATEKQIKFIETLLRRIKKLGTETLTWKNLAWLRENYKTLSMIDASGWIDTLREMVRSSNEISARYSINGRGYQI